MTIIPEKKESRFPFSKWQCEESLMYTSQKKKKTDKSLK
jgi:hypothetical protein